jgi:hypothetical protein
VWLKNSGDVVRGNIFGSRLYPVSVKYWGTEVDFNWYVSEADLENARKLGVDKNGRSGDPEFVDPENGDYRVKNSSCVFETGWNNFPMDRFGVQKEDLKKMAKQPVFPEMITVNHSASEVFILWGGEVKNLETDGEVSATGMYDKTGVLILKKPHLGLAADFEMKSRDVILKINGKTVENIDSLKKILDNLSGLKSVTVWRDQQSVVLKKE